MLVVAAVAAGGAAALTVDTETADTSTTSDLTASTVITQPHNATTTQRVEVSGDGIANTTGLANPETAFTLAMVVNDSDATLSDGTVLYESTDNWTETALTGNDNYYNTTVSNTDFGDALAYGATENVTVDARVTFNESETDEAVTNITFEVAPEGENARLVPGADATSVENNTLLGFSTASLPVIGSGEDSPGAAQVSQSAGVTDTTDEITVSVANDSATDAFAEVADTGSAGSLSTMGVVSVDGQLTPLFVESADAEWLDTESDAYATLSSDGDMLTVHNANETFDDGTESVDIRATGNEALGAQNTFSMLGDYGAGFGAQATTAAGAVDLNGDPFEEL